VAVRIESEEIAEGQDSNYRTGDGIIFRYRLLACGSEIGCCIPLLSKDNEAARRRLLNVLLIR
jgi:hypothetical protein